MRVPKIKVKLVLLGMMNELSANVLNSKNETKFYSFSVVVVDQVHPVSFHVMFVKYVVVQLELSSISQLVTLTCSQQLHVKLLRPLMDLYWLLPDMVEWVCYGGCPVVAVDIVEGGVDKMKQRAVADVYTLNLSPVAIP